MLFQGNFDSFVAPPRAWITREYQVFHIVKPELSQFFVFAGNWASARRLAVNTMAFAALRLPVIGCSCDAAVAGGSAARTMEEANAGDCLVTRTVRGLTAGSDLSFEPRGSRLFKGISEEVALFAATA